MGALPHSPPHLSLVKSVKTSVKPGQSGSTPPQPQAPAGFSGFTVTPTTGSAIMTQGKKKLKYSTAEYQALLAVVLTDQHATAATFRTVADLLVGKFDTVPEVHVPNDLPYVTPTTSGAYSPRHRPAPPKDTAAVAPAAGVQAANISPPGNTCRPPPPSPRAPTDPNITQVSLIFTPYSHSLTASATLQPAQPRRPGKPIGLATLGPLHAFHFLSGGS